LARTRQIPTASRASRGN